MHYVDIYICGAQRLLAAAHLATQVSSLDTLSVLL